MQTFPAGHAVVCSTASKRTSMNRTSMSAKGYCGRFSCPTFSDRNRNKSTINEILMGASQNSEANHASFTSRRHSSRRHPEYTVSCGDISFCRRSESLPSAEPARNHYPHLEPTHCRGICHEIGKRLRLVLDRDRFAPTRAARSV